MIGVSQIGTIDTSITSHESEACRVSSFKELREESGYTIFKLAQAADVSLSTVNRMEYGNGTVTRRIANQVLNVIGERIGRKVTLEEIEGLRLK